jgi:hypothetical protein
MRRVKIRIISEGPTDQLVIKNLVDAYLANQPEIDFELDFVDGQPTTDKTSMTGSTEGGWGMVYKWCLLNPPVEREARYFGKGLFANGMDDASCDALLINMDSDICEEIKDKSIILPVPNKNSPSIERGTFVKNVIESWLWPDLVVHDNKHIIAPSVEAIEAWLVAGLSDTDHDPESNHDIQKRLAELDHLVVKNIPAPTTVKRPKKTKSNYIKILNVATQNVQRIADRCPHFNAMIDEIFRIAKPA